MNNLIRENLPTVYRFFYVPRLAWFRRVKISVFVSIFALIVFCAFKLYTADDFRVTYNTLDVDGLVREYRLVKPLNHEPGVKLPAIIALHGALDLTDEMASHTGLDELVGKNDLIIAYPQGRYRNWPPSIPPENPDVIMPDLVFFRSLCDDLVQNCSVDPDRIYVVGVSQGGAMTNILVNFCSDRIAAAVCNCGWLPKPLGETELQTINKCPMLFVVGSRDRQVSPKSVREGQEAFSNAGHPTEWLLIPDFGHGWARKRGLNDTVWNFLSQYSLHNELERGETDLEEK